MGLTSAVAVGTRAVPALGMVVIGVSRLRARRAGWEDSVPIDDGEPLVRLPDRELRQRLEAGDPVEEVDLRRADLGRAALAGSALAGRDLTGARLQKADLAGADLRGCRLDHADLSGASLAGADLREASVTDASFVGADLRDADLRGLRNAATATWTKVKHSRATTWPESYDPRNAGSAVDRLGADTLALHRLAQSHDRRRPRR